MDQNFEEMETIEEIIDNESTFILTDEDGVDYSFELVGYVDHEESLYVVLAPADADPESEEDLELVVMTIKMDDGVPAFEAVEDEDVAQAVLDKFIASLEEEEEV